MRTRLILVSVLAVFSSAARAEGPALMTAPQMSPDNNLGSFTAVDTALVGAQLAIKTMQECVKLTASLRAGLTKKQQDLKAEFGGSIPASFNELLLSKRKRLDKQQARCLQELEVPGQLYARAHTLLEQFEPKNLLGITARFKKIEAGRARYRQVLDAMKQAP